MMFLLVSKVLSSKYVPIFISDKIITCLISVSGDLIDSGKCIKGNHVRVIIGILPAWFRFAQCLRRYRDTREVFPHLVNAGKYSTGFFVAVFSSINAYYEIMYADKYGPGIVRMIFDF